MNFYPIKEGFTGGVLSPSARGKVTSEAYGNGMSECNNWTITPQGSLRNRYGYRFSEEIAGINEGKLITFPRNIGDDAVVLITGDEVSIRNREGIVEGAGLIARDPTLSARNRFWKGRGTGLGRDYVWSSGYRVYMNVRINSGSKETYLRQKITNAPEDTYRLQFRYASETGPRKTKEDDGFRPEAKFTDLIIKVGTTEGSSNIFQTTIQKRQWSNPRDVDETFSTVGHGEKFYVQLELDDPGSTSREHMHGAVYAPITLTGSDVTPVTFPSPWDSDELEDIQFAVDSGADVMYLVHPNIAPYELDYDEATRAWSFALASFTMDPPEWTGDNWPSVVEIFQSRLWLGSTPDEPSTLWASKTGSYLDFTVGSGPDDALDLTLAASGVIQWLKGHNNLLIGTDNGEWECKSSGGIITPSDVQFNRQSGYGSADIQPVYSGQQIAYAGLDRGKIRTSNQSEEAKGWVSTEISINANNLLNGEISEIEYALEPDFLLYCLLETGQLAICTYDRMNQLLSWHSTTTDGDIKSISVTNEISGKSIWILVERNNGLFLEIQDANIPNRRHLDSYINSDVDILSQREGGYNLGYSSGFNGGFAADETSKGISGLSHLELQIVSVVLETVDEIGDLIFTYIGDFTVSGGMIIIPSTTASGTASTGLKYTATAKTLPQEGGNQAGTSQGSKRKYSQIFSRIASSIPPKLNGFRANVPESQIISVAESTVLTGDFEVRNIGYDKGVIVIEQDIPLRTEVVAVFGKAVVNKL